jgi:large subunit ribosomal protein L25
VVYGQGKDSVSVSIATRDVEKMIRAGRHIVELGGDVTEDALVKEVQWDAFGSHVLHLDFARIDAGQSVEVALAVELRGVAPGTRSGGVVKHMLHELIVKCPANKMPEQLEVNINELELDQVITAGEITLPEAAELLVDGSEIVVTCVTPTAETETDDDGVSGMAEPEVIGRKADDDGDDS